MSKRYAVYNGSSLAANLEIQKAGDVVTTTASAQDINRTVFLTLPQIEDRHSAEFLVYGYAASIANKVSIGIAAVGKANTTYVGADNESIGYRVGEGAIYRNGSSIATVASGALDDMVGIGLDFAPDGGFQLSFKKNDVVLHTETISGSDPLIGEQLVLAVSVGSTDAGDISVFARTGKHKFKYPFLGYSGWWHPVEFPETLRISTIEYLSSPTDPVPNTRWVGCIADESALITRSLKFWPDGSRSSIETAALSLTVLDENGDLDKYIGSYMRDQPVHLQQLEEGEDVSAATTVGKFVIESIEAIDDFRKKINLKDDLILLNKPLQNEYFLPNASKTAANRAWPTAIGCVFSFPPVQYDEEELLYAIDSVGIQNAGKVRDRALALVPATDYEFVDQGRSVKIIGFDPAGTITVDVSVLGADYTYEPPVPEDALDGIGAPFAGTEGGAITGWTSGSEGSGTVPTYTLFGGVPCMSFAQEGHAQNGWALADTITLEADRSYVWEITINSWQEDVAFAGPTRLLICQEPNIFSAYVVIGAGILGHPDTVYPITLTGTLTAHAAVGVYLMYDSNNVAIGTPARVSNFTLTPLPIVDPSGDEDEVDDAIEPLPLAPMLREVLENRAGFPSDYWSYADAELIDDTVLYRGSGFATTEQVTTYVPVRMLLEGYTCDIFKDRNGVARIARLIFPEDVASENWDGHLYDHQMLTDLVPVPDDAPGLTTQMYARRNYQPLGSQDTGPFIYDGAVSTDTVIIPMGLRRKLAKDFRFTVSTGIQVAPQYDHAESNDPLETCLNEEADAQAELERVLTGFTKGRCYWSTSIAQDVNLELGQIIGVHYPRYGIDYENGTPMMVKEISEDLINETMRTVKLWGLSPAELLGE